MHVGHRFYGPWASPVMALVIINNIPVQATASDYDPDNPGNLGINRDYVAYIYNRVYRFMNMTRDDFVSMTNDPYTPIYHESFEGFINYHSTPSTKYFPLTMFCSIVLIDLFNGCRDSASYLDLEPVQVYFYERYIVVTGLHHVSDTSMYNYRDGIGVYIVNRDLEVVSKEIIYEKYVTSTTRIPG